MIASIDHAGIGSLQTITKCQGRMIQIKRSDTDVIDLKTALGKIMEADARSQFVQCDRKIGVLHLARKSFAE